MELDPLNRSGRISWIIAIATLGVIAAAQGYQIALSTRIAGQVDPAHRKDVHRLAWLAVTVLSVDLVMLFWLSLRYLSARGRRHDAHAATPYVDAWAAAGQRLDVSEPENGDDDEFDEDEFDD